VRLVLDASAAIGIATGRATANPLRLALPEADEVLAPGLFVAEVTNTIWKYHEFSDLTLGAGDSLLEDAIGLVDTLVSCRELYRAASALSRAAHRPGYDMFYLALARREGAQLLTLDKRCERKPAVRGSPCCSPAS
jgi:predicted nucleic acid-binding protein